MSSRPTSSTSHKQFSDATIVKINNNPIGWTSVAPLLAILFFAFSPDALDRSFALALWKYSHNTNLVCSLLSSSMLVMMPPSFLKGSQATRYAQLCGVGFLNVAFQSYSAVSSMEADSSSSPALTEAAFVATLAAIIYNIAFATMTWPMRIHDNSPPMNGAEKFFVSLAVVYSVGMIPALFLN